MEHATTARGNAARDIPGEIAEMRARLKATPLCQQCQYRKPTRVVGPASRRKYLCAECAETASRRAPVPPKPARSSPAMSGHASQTRHGGRRATAEVLALLDGMPDHIEGHR